MILPLILSTLVFSADYKTGLYLGSGATLSFGMSESLISTRYDARLRKKNFNAVTFYDSSDKKLNEISGGFVLGSSFELFLPYNVSPVLGISYHFRKGYDYVKHPVFFKAGLKFKDWFYTLEQETITLNRVFKMTLRRDIFFKNFLIELRHSTILFDDWKKAGINLNVLVHLKVE